MTPANHDPIADSATRFRAILPMIVLAVVVAPAWAATIDDFSTAQSQISDPPGTPSNVGGGGIIGGQRDLGITLLTGAGPVTAEVTGGLLLLRVPDTSPDSRGLADVTWDGDTDPGTLDPVGLGGVDLTAGDHTGFRLTVDAAGAGAEVIIEVFTDGANASRTGLVLPAVAAATTFDVSYSGFVTSLGAGADFANVGAITMSVSSIEQDVDLALLETAGPAIGLGDASKAAVLVVDNDGDGRADPGDVLRYTVTITNTGGEATSVSLDDVIQPNLVAVTDSLFTEPIAAPDSYLACGNVTLSVDGSPALPGLTANDHDPDGEAFSITTSFPLATLRGGSVDLVDAVAGSFEYVPPAGFRGVDSFSYEIQDAGGRMSAATVNLIVDSLVWFVDRDAPAGGSGQQTAPFNSLGDVQAASGPGDTIFVFAGSGDSGDGIVLQDRQQLVGEGVGLNACGTQVVAPGSRPTLVNTTSTVVTLASGNRIAGLNIEPEGSEYAIVGNLFTGLEVEQVGIDTSRGGAANGGIDLTDALGTVTIDGLAIAGTGTGTAFSVIGGTPSLTVSNSAITPSGGQLLRVIQVAGGTIDFQPSTTLSLVGGTGDAVHLSLNVATVSIASLGDLETTNGDGLDVSSTSSLMLDSLGSVTATNGAAVRISSTAVGKINPGVLTFTGLASSGSPSDGVMLSGVAPALSVSGPTVVSSSTGHGINLVGPNGDATFSSVTIDGTGGSGLLVSSNTGAVNLNGGAIGAITVPTGNAVDIDSGFGDVNVTASVSGALSARSVEVTNRTGGTVTLAGAIDENGTGINLNSNSGSTITFTGGLDLDTAGNTAFNATGGGTVNVTGSANTIDTTTGTGVNIANTDLGASGVTFRSVSVNGAASGIVLNNTGAGGFFEVTGDGPSDPANTARGRTTAGSGGAIALGSGGTLLNTTGDAVSLTGADNVALRNMVFSNNNGGIRDGVSATNGADSLVLDNVRITGFSDNGILASDVTGVSLQHCEVESNAKSANSIANDEANIRFDNVFGNAMIANSLIRDVFEDNIRVSSCEAAPCGAILDLTLDNVAVQDTLPGAGGNAGVLVRSFNDADVSLTVDGSELVRNRASAIQHTTNDPATSGSTTVTNSTINRNTHAINLSHQGSTTTHSFNIDNNQINTVVGIPVNYGNAVNLFLAGLSGASAVFQGHIINNTIGDGIIADSGSENGNGIDLYASGAGTLTANVANNTIRAIKFGSAFRASSVTHTGNINLTVKNNDFSVQPTTQFPLAGLMLNAGAVAGDTGTMCADITGNIAFVGDTFFVGAFIQTVDGSPTINLVGYGGAVNNKAQIEAFLDAAATTVNPAAWASLGAGTVQGQVAACTMPPAP